MVPHRDKSELLSYIGGLTFIVLGLYLTSIYSYLLFHSLVEIITIAIGFTLFILTLNTRKYLANNYLRLLGIGYAFIAMIDMLHTLAYKGMNIFPGYGANLPTQLWIAARYLQAVTLCAAPLVIAHRVANRAIVAAFAATVSVLVALIYSGNFPDCFIEGKGLTPFKIGSEYLISALLLGSLYLLYQQRKHFNSRVFHLATASIACTTLSEVSFTAYVSVYGFTNMVGHFSKLAAFYLIYRAILVTGLKEPFDLIFRDLKQAEDALRKAHETLEVKVRERTEELHMQAVELEEEVAERQMAQESLQEQTVLLEEEVEKRRLIQSELEQLNERLEQRVQERTAELSEMNEQLEVEINEREQAEKQLQEYAQDLAGSNSELFRAYDDLKRVQAQLLQQDKMASIGQLAAGVAHEINNPMGFIISNLTSLGRYMEKVTAYLDASEHHFATCDTSIGDLLLQDRKKFKIDQIRTDLPELIRESQEGAERVRRIVQDLKSFSRIDSASHGYFDLNDGLESTLSIVWNELKYKTTVNKEYGKLPQVWCNLGQLNQVFMNLLVNAAQAIETQGEILIRTWAEAEEVGIAISDTGNGIPAETLSHVFDPFFTTKEVGKGTGLGLAIAYDIVVNKHGGSIGVKSQVGEGTCFTIMLPVKQVDESNHDK